MLILTKFWVLSIVWLPTYFQFVVHSPAPYLCVNYLPNCGPHASQTLRVQLNFRKFPFFWQFSIINLGAKMKKKIRYTFQSLTNSLTFNRCTVEVQTPYMYYSVNIGIGQTLVECFIGSSASSIKEIGSRVCLLVAPPCQSTLTTLLSMKSLILFRAMTSIVEIESATWTLTTFLNGKISASSFSSSLDIRNAKN